MVLYGVMGCLLMLCAVSWRYMAILGRYVALCGVLWRDVALYGVLWRFVALCGVMWGHVM